MGKDGIRLNTIHPNAVFDTGIWTEEILKSRAEQYGLSIEEYKTNNLLGVEINSLDVSELAAENVWLYIFQNHCGADPY